MDNKNTKKFLLFSNCIPVKGASRSLICDLWLQKFHFIPNALYEILTNFNGRTINDVKNSYPSDTQIIDGYFDFLRKESYIFFPDNVKSFPAMDLKWKYPGKISNAILDFNKNSTYKIANIIPQLDTLGCSALEIRCFDSFDFDFYERTLKPTQDSRLKYISLIVKFSDSIKIEQWQKFSKNNGRIMSISVHSSPNDYKHSSEEYLPINFIKQELKSADCCGNICSSYFTLSPKHFSEAQEFNTCLNRKISVDTNGYIKNCPSQKEHFGHINSNSLTETVLNKKFTKLWNIKKDDIKVCKDCEFRYICTDCRVNLSDKNDIYSKPAKCSYNPYTTKW